MGMLAVVIMGMGDCTVRVRLLKIIRARKSRCSRVLPGPELALSIVIELDPTLTSHSLRIRVRVGFRVRVGVRVWFGNRVRFGIRIQVGRLVRSTCSIKVIDFIMTDFTCPAS